MSQGRRSWIPGSRAIPGTARQGRPPGDAPRNEPIPAVFRTLLPRSNTVCWPR